MSKLTIPIYEFSNVPSYGVATLPIDPAITDPNITIVVGAVAGVARGNPGQSKLVLETDKDLGAGAPVADVEAQKEIKWLVRYSDNTTGKVHTFEIPTAKLSLLDGTGKFLDVSAGAGLVLKNNVTAFMKAPDTGNAVTFVSAEFVTRKMKGNS